MKKIITSSKKLNGICYDIRGPIASHASRLESEGHKILKLNIGNTAPFGFNAPDEIINDIVTNLRKAEGYTESKGLFSARKAIMHETQRLNIPDVSIDDIFIGNGISELISLSVKGLLDNGDEILIPSPDYPLWTASVKLAGGKPVHYLCDEQADWFPDIEDIKRNITSNTRGIVVINPNNPTGAVYSQQILEDIIEVARQHDLIIFADEIYSKITYDDVSHIPISRLSRDVLCVNFNGMSKAYRVPGFRAGWMFITGDKQKAKSYIEGLNILSSMRLCANVPAMLGIQTALGGYQSIQEFTKPGGRLLEQRNFACEVINSIAGLSCTTPKGAFYLFPKVDVKKFSISSDERWVLEFLQIKKVLLVQGSAFNWRKADHFRIVFLPHLSELAEALYSLGDFFDTYQQKI